MGKVKKAITLDRDVAERIEKLAFEDSRNFSQMVNKILKDYIAKNN